MNENNSIDHPVHYKAGNLGLEPIDIIEDQKFNYSVGCAFKYIWRYRFKNKPVEDLRKAAWYLNREADFLEKANKSGGR